MLLAAATNRGTGVSLRIHMRFAARHTLQGKNAFSRRLCFIAGFYCWGHRTSSLGREPTPLPPRGAR